MPRPAPTEPLPLTEELALRAERLKSSDPVGAARALVELGVHVERVVHDRRAALELYGSAASLVRSLQPALTRLRRLLEGRGSVERALAVLEDELSAAEDDALRADLLAERARLCEYAGRREEAREAFLAALAIAPLHPAASRGLESLLRRELGRTGAPPGAGAGLPGPIRPEDAPLASLLAAHLERVAEAVSPGPDREGDARLAAWIHVERAEVLDRLLSSGDAARAALERAVSFDPSPGPVRDALTRHLVLHRDEGGLVRALSVEAEHERDDERAARLFYVAGRFQCDRLNAPMDAIELQRKAAARTRAPSASMRRILAELIRLLEWQGEPGTAAEVRQRQLALAREPEEVVHEHVRLSEIYDTVGQADRAAEHARQALTLDPEDLSTRERLDRALQRLGQHEARVAAWVGEGNVTRDPAARVRALVRAADIAARSLKRRDEAIAILRAAWVVEPGNAEVFDALSALLSPPPRDPEGDERNVRARIDLYVQAANAASEPARKIGLYEKLASIWEDELVQPARAIEVLEQILEIDPKRRTAILALQRCAERAGDARRLADAVATEARLTSDPEEQRRLYLRAADILAERVGDKDRAFEMCDRALAVDPTDPSALRARARLLEKTGRYDEARRTKLALIARDPQGPDAFSRWMEIAVLDRQRRKNAHDAADAYREAARLRPAHPLPRIEIARLLREVGDWAKLAPALMALAAEATDKEVAAELWYQASEAHELALGDDEQALRCLAEADALASSAEGDPGVLEAMERIHARRADAFELAALYARWLERKPPPAVDHGLRVALARVLAEGDKKHAAEILEGLIGVVPGHLPAIRMLQHLYRSAGAHADLARVLRAEVDVLTSPLGRCSALWELVSLEEHLGPAATLDALVRLVTDAPADTVAQDAIVRIASRIVEGGGVPPPTALATRVRLGLALQAQRELARDRVSKALLHLEEAVLVEGGADEPGAPRSALAGYRAALALWPDSLVAARGLHRLAQHLGDRSSLVVAERALAKLVSCPAHRAGHMVRAADLMGDELDPVARYQRLELYEEALRTDPDNAEAARALSSLLATDTPRLGDRLAEALERATVSDQIVLLGTEMGRAALRPQPAGAGPSVTVAIECMRRVLAELPDDVHALLLMSNLMREAQLWGDARDTLLRVVEVARDQEAQIAAHFELSEIYEGPLEDSAAAEASLNAVLALDAKNRLALERLYQVAKSRGDHGLAINALGRLADGETDPSTRVDFDLRLAEACREAGDRPGMIRALCDAAVSSPGDGRAWKMLASLHRSDTPEGASAYAKTLGQLLEIASARRAPYDHRWLTTLGLLEATILRRPMEGLAHLQQAVTLPGAPPEARVALGRGLEAVGRNVEAVQVLRDVLTVDRDTLHRLADVSTALSTLESALAKDGRAEERLAVEEVRACLGEVKGERVSRLRARRLPPDAPYAMVLAGSEIARILVPEARSPLIDVSVAIAPIAAKVLRFELASLGVASRDRVGMRDGHPARALAERIARALGVEGFDLYLSQTWQGAARVFAGDPPAIVASTAFADLAEPEQIFALGRLLTRIALGAAWLDELGAEAVDGLLLAALRMAEPSFGVGDVTPGRERSAQGFIGPMQRAIGRRQRKLLEEIAPTTSPQYDARAFVVGVRRSEYRAAYVLAGDLVSSIDYLRRTDREIGRASEESAVLLRHPVTNELLRYALTADAYAERRRAGTAWTP